MLLERGSKLERIARVIPGAKELVQDNEARDLAVQVEEKVRTLALEEGFTFTYRDEDAKSVDQTTTVVLRRGDDRYKVNIVESRNPQDIFRKLFSYINIQEQTGGIVTRALLFTKESSHDNQSIIRSRYFNNYENPKYYLHTAIRYGSEFMNDVLKATVDKEATEAEYTQVKEEIETPKETSELAWTRDVDLAIDEFAILPTVTADKL